MGQAIDPSVRFPNEGENGWYWAQGRNGTAHCAGLRFWNSHSKEYVWIDFYKSRGNILNVGARVPATTLDQLRQQYLTERGYRVEAPDAAPTA